MEDATWKSMALGWPMLLFAKSSTFPRPMLPPLECIFSCGPACQARLYFADGSLPADTAAMTTVRADD